MDIRDPQTTAASFLGTFLAVLVYAFLLAPLMVIVPIAFGPINALSFPPASYSLDLYRILFSSSDWLWPLYQSFKVAVSSTALSLLAGVPAAYWLSRHEFIGKSPLTGIVMSPVIIPHVVIALGLFLYFSYARISGTTIAIVFGHTICTMPFVIVMVAAGVSKLDRNLEFGAELMGASPLRMFFTVVLPQLVPSLVSAALFAFLLSFDEVTISWFLAGTGTVTLPVRMFSALEFEASPVIAAVSTLLMAVSVLVCVVGIMLRRADPVQP